MEIEIGCGERVSTLLGFSLACLCVRWSALMSIAGFHVAARGGLTLLARTSGVSNLSSSKMSGGRRGIGVDMTSLGVVFDKDREIVLSERDLEVWVCAVVKWY